MGRYSLSGLAQRRKEAGLTQEELAARVGVSRGNIANWETGVSWPLARLLPTLAGALGCTIDELYQEAG